MLESLHLTNVGPAPRLDVEFGSRLNLITGDNGLGKSFLLDVAWWALTRHWPHDVNPKLTSGYRARPSDPARPATIEFAVRAKSGAVSYRSTYSPRDEAWTGKSGRPLNPGLVIYAHTDGGFSVWDPARNYWKKKGGVDVQERLPAFVFSAKDVWDGLKVQEGGASRVVCKGLIEDWATWIKEKGEAAAAMAFVLRLLSPVDDANPLSRAAPPLGSLRPGPLVRLSVDDVRDVPSLITGYGEPVPILHASSGVRRVVSLCYMLLWSILEHKQAAMLHGAKETTHQLILIFDELESHLHPQWQRRILSGLLRFTSVIEPLFLKDVAPQKIQLIATTHSPLVLASAEPLFDAKTDAWFDFDLRRTAEGASVELRKRDFVRQGDASAWLTSEAFDLKEPTSVEAERAVTRALALFVDQSPTPDAVSEVDGLLRKSLGEQDPFWLRWAEFRSSREATG